MDSGARVWVTDAKDGWTLATVSSRTKSGDFSVTLKNSGEETTKKTEEVCAIMGSEPGSLKSIEDLTRLPALHEAALLQALQERFDSDQIYTSVGPILIAVNPFKKIANLYQTKRFIAQEKNLPPHVYGLANATFMAMVDYHGQNQSILVSGESGAGKTETTKHAMQYLTEVSGGGEGSKSDVSARILQANPLLEAFGNAKTIRNDNSSRFGKLIEMRFADQGRHKLIGAGVTSYLLEKARVVHQARGERNYHIFYELFANGNQASKFKLTSPKQHRYLNGSGEYSRADVTDSEQVERTLLAMQTLGFSSQDCEAVLQIVAGILHLGDVDFKDEKGGEACSIANPTAVALASEMLGILPGKSTDKSLTSPESTLSDVLCVRKINVHGLNSEEQYVKTFNSQFAREARDALAMSLYERLFAWIVWRVNFSMISSGGPEDSKAANEEDRKFRIGILDIFGFEVFEENYFEQLCINYANEQLQRQFNEHVFELEQKMYEKEGVDWTFVEFPDNSPTILLIESKPIGLLSLIDEECIYPNGGDRSLHAKLVQNLKQFDKFSCTSNQARDFQFTIKHFAGDVTYQVEGFYRKNKNEIRQDAVELVCSSNKFLVRILLPPDSQEAAGGADASKYFSKRALQLGKDVLSSPASSQAREWETKPLPLYERQSLPMDSHHRVKSSTLRKGSQIQQMTVSSHFKNQLHSALTIIRASKPSYVRCLKPNDRNRPQIYNRVRVLDQLRYSGVVEVIKVARAGYPTRFELEHFVDRYAVLIPTSSSSSRGNAALMEARKLIKQQNVKALQQCCQSVCETGAKLKPNIDFQVGKTKVFLRAEATGKLESAKEIKIRWAVKLIQRSWRKYFKMHRFDRAATKIQRVYRGIRVRRRTDKEFQRRRAAAAFIHSSPNMKRWIAEIRKDGKAANKRAMKKVNQTTKVMAKEQEDIQQMWWIAVPVVVLISVPTLAQTNPQLLALILLACLGAMAGSMIMLDPSTQQMFVQQPRRAVKETRKRVQTNLKKPIAKLQETKRQAQAGLFMAPKSPINRSTSPVEIKVNGEALKRFAGLAAAKRKEAMDRARKKAEDMYFNGELEIVKPQPMAAAPPQSSTKSTSGKTPPKLPDKKPSAGSNPQQPRTPEKKKEVANNNTNSKQTATVSKQPPALPNGKPKPGLMTETKPRADTSMLDPDEQYHLNKAILSMFLEEQAPDQVDMADELLMEFSGKEEALFEKLTEEFPHVDALKSDETPVWDRFIKRKSSRSKRASRGSRGFFGMVGPSLEDEIRAIQELNGGSTSSNNSSTASKHTSSIKAKVSVAKHKTEQKAKAFLGKLTSGGH